MKAAFGVFILFILVFLVSGCGPEASQADAGHLPAQSAPGNTDATGFEIHPFPGGADLLVLDPWNGSDTFASYHVVYEDKKWERWAVFSTTHIGFLDALGESDRVVGCTTPDRIYHADLYEKFKSGDLIRIGSDMEYNFESLLDQKPDLVIQTGFAGQKTKDARILNTGIDLVYVMEWLEPTPLARAEWIRVFGLLLNKQELADSIFQTIRAEYLALCESVTLLEDRPEVFVGNNFKGTWFMPGGNNYMSKFLIDAGFSYPYFESKESGSLPLSFESVMHTFGKSPIWLGVSAETLDQLLEEDERYALFTAFQNKKVFSLTNRVVREMGNDYWEGGVIQPHIILKDLIHIAHPEMDRNHELVFYKQIK